MSGSGDNGGKCAGSRTKATPCTLNGMTEEQDETLAALRGVWGANTQSAEDLEQFCPTAKVCKNVADLGIKGMDDDNMAVALRSEWKAMLESDGKLRDDAETIADLVAAAEESQR